MITDSARYQDGRRLAAAGTPGTDGGFVWIGLADPGEAEFTQVGAVAGLPAGTVAQALRAPRAPGVTRLADALLVVLTTVQRDGAAMTTGQLVLLVGEGFVLTVRHGPPGPMRGLRARLEQQPRLLAHGPVAVLHAVCAATADEYLAALAERPGSRVLTAAARQVLGPLHELSTGLLPALREPTERLAAACAPPPAPAGATARPPAARPAGPRRGTPGSTAQRATAWAALAVPPVLLAGYALVDRQAAVPYGYPLGAGATALACGVLHRLFKRWGWL
ncbi:CorA family divalent cation transporter [Kitasatospora viridis]|uniref:CorA-like Mg2+ transporter protein n=1 Tax=Kitasatospora viridis TaxID=281105 RepID=A0A561UNG8_9ACTN|nr:CorA family divalent cation transporter [Kitasatospora viridis]TWG00902.1 CorA-like Mg2+ transporter protein [Kitasatospora viridis]